MKNLIFISSIMLHLFGFSQNKFSISTSISNQGQVDKTLAQEIKGWRSIRY
jgi:hypothetical protein